MSGVLYRNVDVDGEVVDVRVAGPTIAEVGASLRARDELVVDGHGGALLPGLHDHHIHLLATAAARSSVRVGPDDVLDQTGLADALRAADAELEAGAWLRAVGYHESVAGDLDRDVLDALVPDRPLRVQHRTGSLWVLNSAAIVALALQADADAPVERGPDGRVTGRMHRADHWLAERLPRGAPPDLARLGTELARFGVTGVTDATPFRQVEHLDAIADAAVAGGLPQRVVAMGGPELAGVDLPAGIEQGPVKVVLDDDTLPGLDELAGHIDAAHRHGRGAAIHCVTRPSLVLALAAWEQAGSITGDRIEHGSVIPDELVPAIVDLGLTVVTQPGFLAERGDEYLADVEPDDLPHLYRIASLLEAGVPVAGSTDAPYTATDPWAAMRAAVARATPSGPVLGDTEVVSPRRALGLFLDDAHHPGRSARAVEPGQPSDLCLLAVPLAVALQRLSADDVVSTWRAGRHLCADHPRR